MIKIHLAERICSRSYRLICYSGFVFNGKIVKILVHEIVLSRIFNFFHKLLCRFKQCAVISACFVFGIFSLCLCISIYSILIRFILVGLVYGYNSSVVKFAVRSVFLNGYALYNRNFLLNIFVQLFGLSFCLSCVKPNCIKRQICFQGNGLFSRICRIGSRTVSIPAFEYIAVSHSRCLSFK